MTETLASRRALRGLRELIATPTDRDLQTKVGPSDLGDPCARCLGRKMIGVQPSREFALAPWIGTSIHTYLENLAEKLEHRPGVNDMAWYLYGEGRAVLEGTFEVAEIPGYGMVMGHVDVLFVIDNVLEDYKSTTKKKIKVYQASGVPTEYEGQTVLYMLGARRAGYMVDEAVLGFIPKDGWDLNDIWTTSIPWSQEVADQVLDRAGNIYKWAKAGRVDELPSDEDCWSCHPRYFG